MRDMCCVDCSEQVQQRTKSSRSTPAQGPGKPGIVHLFGGVFVGAVAEEMYRTLQVIVQSNPIDLSALPAPTAHAGGSVDSSSNGSSSSSSSDESPLPAASRLSRGDSSPPEGQQAAGDGVVRPTGVGAIPAITGKKRTRHIRSHSSTSSGDDDGDCVEGDGCTSFVSECSLPTEKGMFRLRAYRYSGRRKSHEPVVMVCGDVRGRDNVPVRVHDQCQTSEV